jgi:thiol-disulfide isomerase/thioredoxin
VLNFWATWCKPCRAEIPTLVEVQHRFAAQGVQVIGASIDEPEDRKTAEKFVREMGINYPVWFEFTTGHMMPLRLATSIPATAIFDHNGQRVFRIIGEATKKDLAERLEWLLGDRTAPAPAELVLPAGITPEHFKEHEEGKEDEHQEEVARETGSAVPS